MLSVNDTMLKALHLAKSKMSSEANERIKRFVSSNIHPTGGFKDRAKKQDVYYAVFGYSLAFVYDIPIDISLHRGYLKSKIVRHNLDLVHAASLIRCYILVESIHLKQSSPGFLSNLSKLDFIKGSAIRKIINIVKKDCKICFDVIEEYKSTDGGYNQNAKGQNQSTIYAIFLIWSLMQDIQSEMFDIPEVISKYQLEDGSFVNELTSQFGVTSTTAAGLIMSLTGSVSTQSSIDWLKNRVNTHGGYQAGEGVPLSDILSTATALTALKMAGEDMTLYIKSIDFVNLHWDESGGFFGSIADMHPDVEYTFYALLAIGLID